MKTNLTFKHLFFLLCLFIQGTFCLSKTYKSLSKEDAPITITVNKTDNPCPDRSAGKIKLTVSGGTAPYTFLWNDGAITKDRNNLFRGNYTVTVTDFSGVTESKTITISDPVTMNILGTGTNNVTCFKGIDGEQFIEVTGGTPISVINGVNQYTYEWRKNGLIVSNKKDLSKVSAGTYNLRVTDKNSCTADADYVIAQPQDIIIIETTHTNNINFGESNGAIVLDVKGGTINPLPAEPYTYLWNDGVTTKDRSNLPSGIYTVTVTDSKNCFKIFNTTILPLELFVVTGVQVDNKCFGFPNGSIDITTTGGVAPYQYKWDDLPGFSINPNRNNLPAGTYKLTAIDANGLGAKRELNFTLIQPKELIANYSHTDNKCFSDKNGSIIIDANGGVPPYQYILNNSLPAPANIFINNLASGSYTIKIIDANNCQTAEQKIDILPLSALALNNIITDVNCGNPASGKITSSVVGGKPPYNFLWSTGATTPDIQNLSVGDYQLTLTDALGCVISKKITVTQTNSPIIITEINHIDNKCFEETNGSISLNVNGGVAPYIFEWDNGATTSTISNLASGNYTAKITDAITCTKTITISILPLKEITANAIVKDISCVNKTDGSIKLNPDGGTSPYQYFWNFNNTSDFVENLSVGTYRVTITDGNNCSKDFEFDINNAVPVSIETVLIDKPDCGGGTNGVLSVKYIGGTPPYKYELVLNNITPIIIAPTDEITPGELLIKNLVAGTYAMIVTDAVNCPLVFPYIIEERDCNVSNRFLFPDPLMSPNNDGMGNEYFKIKNIESFPDNEVVIYNRWGSEVYRTKGYNNTDKVFKGIANSSLTNTNSVLVDGVYYYTIQTTIDKSAKYNKGYIILKR